MSEETFEQRPFSDAVFAENPESRCPVVLLLDNSTSMSGARISELNEALQGFRDDLLADGLAAKRVEVAIVTFGPVKVETEFVGATRFIPPKLEVAQNTPMGAAIEAGLDLLRRRKDTYRANGVSYYRPWVFLITDGTPTDSVDRAVELVREGEASKSFKFFAVGVADADMQTLKRITGTNDPLRLRGLQFRELFQWLSSSLGAVASSKPGDTVPLKDPTAASGWGSV